MPMGHSVASAPDVGNKERHLRRNGGSVMKHRKSFPGIFDDRQLETMGLALDLILEIAHPSTLKPDETVDDYKIRVARQILEIAHGMDYDADYLAQLTLERLIAVQAKSAGANARQPRHAASPQRSPQPHRDHERH